MSEAVLHYVETRGKKRLREQLKTAYLANAEENLRIAAEWFPLEGEALQKGRRRRKAAK